MPVPRVAGYPDYTNDGTNRWIPIIFAGKTLEKFYAASTVANIASTDYVGEVKNVGDTVVIRTVPNITIRDYKKGMTLDLEYPESPAIEFTVNRAKYYNFALDDIDVKQTDMEWIGKFADDAAQQLKIVYDSEVFQTVYAQVDSSNQGSAAGKTSGNINLGTSSTPLALSSSNVLDTIVDSGVVLDEQNIPETDRWIILPPKAAGLLKKSDLKNAALTGDSKSVLRSGLIGSIDRYDIYVSNLLYKDAGAHYHILFGHKSSLVFVAQLTKNEQYRPDNTFADAMKGLVVYDFKVIQSTAMGHIEATIA